MWFSTAWMLGVSVIMLAFWMQHPRLTEMQVFLAHSHLYLVGLVILGVEYLIRRHVCRKRR